MPDVDVRLDRVSKAFHDVVAVDNVSLDILSGEFFSMLGPSGCGKTTTLRMIGGFEEPTAGTVYLGDRDVTDLPSYKRDVNTVFQSYALFPHLDVFENVAFGLRRRHVDKRKIADAVHEIMELVDLKGFERRRITQMSGGQQQRVALARALVNRPKVLLLDEPLGALDLKLRKQMQLELKRIQQEVGITFIYVTHDQEEAMTMSDRLAVMRGGRIEQIGPPQTVYEHPATEFVAGFLGASNLLDGVLEGSEGDDAAVRTESGHRIWVSKDRVPLGIGPKVKVGVRPEKISIVPVGVVESGMAAAEGHRNEIEGVLRIAAYVGVNYQYKVDGPGNTDLTVFVQSQGDAEDQPRLGQKVSLRWSPAHTFLVEPTASTDGTGGDVS